MSPKDTPRYLLITEMAEKYGLTHRALRFYEQKGILKPERVGQVRYYSPEQEAVLRLAIRANRLGLPFPEISRRLDRVRIAIEITADELRTAMMRFHDEREDLHARCVECSQELQSIERAGADRLALREACF